MTLPFVSQTIAPCKVNLALDVGPLRGDGYHEIDSLAVRLSPSDAITVRVRAGTRRVFLTVKDRRPDAVSEPSMPSGPDNLAHRAATVALDALAPNADVDVFVSLMKRLPAQAGLGGGSSDAAAVLIALSQAFGATREALFSLAAALGSDVALFLFTTEREESTPIQLSGRGESVESLGISLPKLYGVLARPKVGVSTGAAYALLDAVPNRTTGGSTASLLAVLSSTAPTVDRIGAALGNDFEAPVLSAYPEVAAAFRAVEGAGALRTILCGSGSAVFGLARDSAHATALVKALVGKVAWLKKAESL